MCLYKLNFNCNTHLHVCTNVILTPIKRLYIYTYVTHELAHFQKQLIL